MNDNPIHLVCCRLHLGVLADASLCMFLAVWSLLHILSSVSLPHFHFQCQCLCSVFPMYYIHPSLSRSVHNRISVPQVLFLYDEFPGAAFLCCCGPQVGRISGQGPRSSFSHSVDHPPTSSSSHFRPDPSPRPYDSYHIDLGQSKNRDRRVPYRRCRLPLLSRRQVFQFLYVYTRVPVLRRHHDWKHGFRPGEATNPGPTDVTSSYQPLSVGLINPTTIFHKEDDLLALNTDILCLAETAATKTVQMAFKQAIRSTSFRTFWSAPVPDKAKSDPSLGTTFRGDNLGTAIMTRLPAREARQTFPPSAWDTCRLNSTVVVSTGALDILMVSAYFQTGKSAEARIVNNQLLQDIFFHIMPIDLPFIIAGDFNTDVRKLDVFSSFRHMGCQEMFEFHRMTFGFELPPTCKGATRFDSMITHPFLLPHIRCIDVGPEHQFADHRAVHVQLDIPTRTTTSFSWFVPKSWTLFPVDREIFATQYRQARSLQYFDYTQSASATPDDIITQLFRWSSQVEKAVDRTLQVQRAADPIVNAQRFLPKTYWGRRSTPRLIRNTCPRSPKRDTTGLCEPPAETTSVKSRHKIRQVRRLRCLERLYRKYQLDQFAPTDSFPEPHNPDLTLLWQAVCKAQGYGNSWTHWIF